MAHSMCMSHRTVWKAQAWALEGTSLGTGRHKLGHWKAEECHQICHCCSIHMSFVNTSLRMKTYQRFCLLSTIYKLVKLVSKAGPYQQLVSEPSYVEHHTLYKSLYRRTCTGKGMQTSAVTPHQRYTCYMYAREVKY